MSLTLIERACERLKKQLSPDQTAAIQRSANINDVRHAIGQIEQHLAARQCLRNFDRLTPFLDAIDRLTKPIDILCNGTPFMSYAWAPLKLIINTAQHHVHALDKLLSAYGSIGLALPRLARYGETFPDNPQFQRLLAYLYSDIIEFHTRALRLIQKPGWKTFFSSGWGRFEHKFDALLQSITQTTELIDKDTMSLDISLAQEWRQKTSEHAAKQEEKMEFEQYEAVLRWLEVGDSKSYQKDKLELLRNHCCEGTSQWLIKTRQIRSWLQFGKGNSVMWLHGKPGSGKSVLCSQLILFLRSDPNRNCLFFYCDFHTKSYAVTAQVLRSLCVQMIDLAPELTSFIYDECVVARSNPSVSCLRAIVPKLMSSFPDIRVIIDGIDEVGYSQHRELIKTLSSMAETQDNCKILFSSQNIPTIFSSLKNKPQLPLGTESLAIAEDIDLIVATALQELTERHNGGIPKPVLDKIGNLIKERAEGMFLWVYLVLEILKGEVSAQDLQASVESLPEDLAGAYSKILTNITRNSSNNSISKQRRAFGWMLFAKGNHPLRKHELRLAMTLHPESSVVSKDTKPFPNALDICHPFIEEGPRGSVVFIHSTVPKFLLDPTYGPFIDKIESHRDISAACLGQLLQGLYLAQGQRDFSQVYRQTGQGFHALLPYAVEYWAEHLLEYLGLVPELDCSPKSQVMEKLLELCREHDRMLRSPEQDVQHISNYIPSKKDQRLECLKNFPEALNLLGCFLDFKQAINTTKSKPSSSPDPTLFWSTCQKYHKAVAHLISQESCIELTAEELMVFKEEFGPTAFVCDVRGCERSLLGYSSAIGLKNHEAQHRGQLRCVEPRCTYNDVGFSSLRQLRDHKRKLHTTPFEKDIPRKIHRKAPATLKETIPVFGSTNELNGQMNNGLIQSGDIESALNPGVSQEMRTQQTRRYLQTYQEQQPQQVSDPRPNPAQSQMQQSARWIYQQMLAQAVQMHGAPDNIPKDVLDNMKTSAVLQAQNLFQQNAMRQRAM